MVDELGQEGKEEEGGLRVEDVDDDALHEHLLQGCRLGAFGGGVVVPREDPSDPDHDQVGGADSFTVVKAVADEATRADKPAVAATTWTKPPLETPSAETGLPGVPCRRSG